MEDHTLDPAAFRAMFPQFASVAIYPNTSLQAWWSMATVNMSAADSCALNGDTLQLALNLMTAHLGALFVSMASGKRGGVLTSASIDKVSVGYASPPFKTGWQFWLSSTPYGLQLWALLTGLAAGGFYVNGAPEAAAFRKVGGYFC